MESILEHARTLRGACKHEEARGLLLELLSKHPRDAVINFDCAVTHDNLGLEAAAIPFYERAIELGLSGHDLEMAILGLGSSYRCIGQYEKSLAVLENGASRFPQNWGIKVFLSMTHYESGNHSMAIKILLDCLTETSTDATIQECKRAISWYAQAFGAKT